MANEKQAAQGSELNALVRRCPICNESDGSMVNYGLTQIKFMMHPTCAARHFQQALRMIDWGEFPGDEYRDGERRFAGEILYGKHLPEHPKSPKPATIMESNPETWLSA